MKMVHIIGYGFGPRGSPYKTSSSESVALLTEPQIHRI